MTDEDCTQSALVIEVGFEREDAKHEVEPARHLLDPAAVPCPNLRTDVVNDFLAGRFHSQCAREPQIESGIINQNDGPWLARIDLAQRFMKLFPEIAVMLDHFPEPEHARFFDPVLKIRTGDRLHPWAAAPDEAKIGIGVEQRVHQRRSVIVRARFARDEVNGLQEK